jgi:hypothetical protein
MLIPWLVLLIGQAYLLTQDFDTAFRQSQSGPRNLQSGPGWCR